MSAKLIEEAARAYCAACDAALPNPGDAREAPVREGIAAVVALVVERAAKVAEQERACWGGYAWNAVDSAIQSIRALAAGTEG